jgi:lipopolysaccharide transport system permease protein
LASALYDLRVVPVAGTRLFVRNLQSKYRQSALQWAWIVVPPLITTLTWVFLNHAGVIKNKGINMPYAAYVGSGACGFQLFIESLTAPMNELHQATEVLKHARLPHESWVFAGVLLALFTFVVRMVVLLPVLVLLGSLGGTTLLLVPLGAIGIALLGTGLGLLLAIPGRLFTDVPQALQVVTGLLFFLTPVFYARPKHGFVGHVLGFNPITPSVITTRAWLTGTSGGLPVPFAITSGVGLTLLLIAWLSYRVAQPHLVARL